MSTPDTPPRERTLPTEPGPWWLMFDQSEPIVITVYRVPNTGELWCQISHRHDPMRVDHRLATWLAPIPTAGQLAAMHAEVNRRRRELEETTDRMERLAGIAGLPKHASWELIDARLVAKLAAGQALADHARAVGDAIYAQDLARANRLIRNGAAIRRQLVAAYPPEGGAPAPELATATAETKGGEG